MAASRYVIGDFKHRVSVCSMRDVAVGTDISLTRKDVYQCWAKIIPMSQSLFNGTGDAIKQSREIRTHKIIIRFRRDIDFTQTAWFYEERRQSGARWFKLLEFAEQNEASMYLEANCRLVGRGDQLTPPVTPVATGEPEFGAPTLPNGIAL
jgi:head-tail adaptor